MTVNLQQYNNASQTSDLEQLRNAQDAQRQSQKISNQATDDALWRMAQNNEMAKINLTLEQASDLISQMKTAEAGRVRFMDIVMPNGKKLAECRGEYVRDVGRALEQLTRDSPVDQRVLR